MQHKNYTQLRFSPRTKPAETFQLFEEKYTTRKGWRSLFGTPFQLAIIFGFTRMIMIITGFGFINIPIVDHLLLKVFWNIYPFFQSLIA